MSRFCWCEQHPFQLALLVAIADDKEHVEVKVVLVVELQDEKKSKQVLDVVKKRIPWVSASMFELV
jgi:hypothetical protein